MSLETSNYLIKQYRRKHRLSCKGKETIWEKLLKEDADLKELYQIRKNKDICTIGRCSDYLKLVLYPILIPAFEAACVLTLQYKFLNNPKQIFDVIDCISELLYYANPRYPERQLHRQPIYFVYRFKNFMKINPRPVYPLHWVLTKDEAATIIQALVRGFLTRRKVNLEDMRTERLRQIAIMDRKKKCAFFGKSSKSKDSLRSSKKSSKSEKSCIC